MAEDLGEKSEKATPKKLQQARNKGQVPKSQDFTAAIELAGGMILIFLFLSMLGTSMFRMFERVLSSQTLGSPISPTSVDAIAWFVFMTALRVLLPIFGLVFIVAFLANFLQVGPLFTLDPIKPKLDKINVISGIKRLFSLRNLIKSLVNTFKLVFVLGTAILVIRHNEPQFVTLPLLELFPAAMLVGRMLAELVIWLLVIMLIIGIIDLVYQRWQHRKDQKMTKLEVKDERKSMDGDPETRKRRMKMAAEIAMQQIKSAVPEADVIVTNPTHFSVALKYRDGEMEAPKVVAKGADLLAFRIREIARANGIPIVEKPPLARGLYWGVEIGQEVSPEFYQAIAEVLAYVYRMKEQNAA